MQKLVFSRCSGKLGTATRHQGPKTGTVWSVRENPSKSPKRPALPGAVNREGAVSRHRPFVLLANHTPFRGAKCGFPNSPCTGPNLAFWGSGRVLSPPRRETPHTGPHSPEKPGAFPKEKTGAAHPRVSPGAAVGLVLHTGVNRRIRSGLPPGAKKPLPGLAGQRLWAL